MPTTERRFYRVVGKTFVCGVYTDTSERRVIREAAPLLRRFIGQPLHHLLRWSAVVHYHPMPLLAPEGRADG